MSSDGAFDDIVDELGGFGKYQKRLLYTLLCKCYRVPFTKGSLNHAPILRRPPVPDHALPPPAPDVRAPLPRL